jgi:hypothetical protein
LVTHTLLTIDPFNALNSDVTLILYIEAITIFLLSKIPQTEPIWIRKERYYVSGARGQHSNAVPAMNTPSPINMFDTDRAETPFLTFTV